MNKPSTFLAVIPARKGSKRLPKKNILKLNGKPLISYTIEAALKSKYLSSIVVTSDDEEIINIAKSYKINTINRKPELSNDTADSTDVVLDVIEQQTKNYDYILLLQPTSPLRTSKHIDEAIEQLLAKKANCIISMCEVDHPIQWCTKLDETKSLENFIHNFDTKRSQDLEKFYRLNGAIYLIKTNKFLEEKNLFIKENIFCYLMNKEDSIDIDDRIDFLIAQEIIRERDKTK